MDTEIIYGIHPVMEVLRARKRRCSVVYISKGRREIDAQRVEETALRCGVSLKRVGRDEIAMLAQTEKHQGVAARVDPFPYGVFEEIVQCSLSDQRKGFLLLLDCITDPQNVGSLIRTAYLMGVHGVVIPRDRSAAISPAVVKASAGATEYLPVSQVTNLVETIRFLKEKGFWISGAEGSSGDSVYFHDFREDHVAIVMGAEGKGLRRMVRERCDHLLSIPMGGVIGSYNTSVAGGIFMAEVVRQRLEKPQAKTVPNGSKMP